MINKVKYVTLESVQKSIFKQFETSIYNKL